MSFGMATRYEVNRCSPAQPEVISLGEARNEPRIERKVIREVPATATTPVLKGIPEKPPQGKKTRRNREVFDYRDNDKDSEATVDLERRRRTRATTRDGDL